MAIMEQGVLFGVHLFFTILQHLLKYLRIKLFTAGVQDCENQESFIP